MKKSVGLLGILVPLAFVPVASCSSSSGSGSGSGGGQCGAAVVKLNGCGFSKLTQSPQWDCEEASDQEERCLNDCFLKASCENLVDGYCRSDYNWALPCIQACEPPPYQCADGEIVSGGSRCDGYTDCLDGSDEAGCPTFTCQNGELVSANAKCDDWEDCSDGSDELGCGPPEPQFDCGDGTTVPQSFVCDDYPDCTNGSDEPATCGPDPLEAACADLGVPLPTDP